MSRKSLSRPGLPLQKDDPEQSAKKQILVFHLALCAFLLHAAKSVRYSMI